MGIWAVIWNQVTFSVTWFVAPAESGSHFGNLILAVTESVGQSGPLKKPDELRAEIRKSLPVSLPGAKTQTFAPFFDVKRWRWILFPTTWLSLRPYRNICPMPAFCWIQIWATRQSCSTPYCLTGQRFLKRTTGWMWTAPHLLDSMVYCVKWTPKFRQKLN